MHWRQATHPPSPHGFLKGEKCELWFALSGNAVPESGVARKLATCPSV